MKPIITSLLLSLLTVILILSLMGCNKQVFDFDYTFNYAIINLGGEYKELKIISWKDYEGEQIQIKDTEGNTYLTNTYNCTLIHK